MQIQITRSFVKRIQLKQFEPIESTCSITASVDVKKIENPFLSKDEYLYQISSELDELCKKEVDKSLRGKSEELPF